uniref:hypothetical protein n=1 Tax=Flavobacterium sp. TaxID=239 RepID=UPI0037BEB028
MFRIFFLLFLLFVGCKKDHASQKEILTKIEDIQARTWQMSDTVQVKKLLIEGLSLSNLIVDDTIQISYSRKMACEYFNHKMFNPYLELTISNLDKAKKLKDSSYIATLLLDKGDYFQSIYKIDSAYFYYRKSLPYHVRNSKHQILTNFQIALMLTKENLDTESETILYQNLQNAIDYGDPEIIYRFYNILGINYTNTNQFDFAIDAFNNALLYNDKIAIEKMVNLKSKNKTKIFLNIAWSYQQAKKYDLAKKYYEKSENEQLKNNEPHNLTFLLINQEKLNRDTNQTINLKNCYKALKVAEENNVQENIVNAKHLIAIAAFKNNDQLLAFKVINEAIELANELRLNLILEEIYTTLKQYDLANETKWLKKLVEIKAIIMNDERQTRNKFAKITYETEVVHQKNIELTKKISNQVIYGVIFSVFIAILFVLFRIRTYNKILKMDQEQKENNLTIFNLMVAQQDMLEKGKSMEKSRLSKELHDGIAGQIYIMRFLTEINLKKDAMPKIEVE